MQFDMVVATDANGGIGKDNSIPWRLSDDLKYFRKLTSAAPEGKRNAVIMGRKTWESIPSNMRPLKNRLNIVLSRSPLDLPEGVMSAASLDAALLLSKEAGAERCFVIGGAQIYAEGLAHPDLGVIYLTQIEEIFDCDVFFPRSRELQLVETTDTKTEGDIHYRYQIFRPVPAFEKAQH